MRVLQVAGIGGAVKTHFTQRGSLANIILVALALALIAAAPSQALTNGNVRYSLRNFSSPAPSQSQQQPQTAKLSPDQLQQAVAPIALYPDALVAQILAGAAYPDEIEDAQHFLQDNPDLKGAELAAEVDKKDWDPSVKALTQFPSVLSNMDKNLAWTKTLGEANQNQQADVLDAVQFMRQKAQAAGNLSSTPQQTVTNQDQGIVIQPTRPQVVYVPVYDPAVVYGYPVGIWPGFHPWWGLWGGGPYFRWGFGFGIGPWAGFGWGWRAWGFNWAGRGLLFHGGVYAFHNGAAYARGYAHGVAAANRTNANGRGNQGQAGKSGGTTGAHTGGRSGTQGGTRGGTRSGGATGANKSGRSGGSSNGKTGGASGTRGGRSGGAGRTGAGGRGGSRGGGGGHGGGRR